MMMLLGGFSLLNLVLCLCGLVGCLASTLIIWGAVRQLWWHPRRVSMALKRQGVHGPPPAGIISGHLPHIFAMRAHAMAHDMPSTTHAIASRLFPHVSAWTKLYGKVFTFMWGPEIRLAVTDMEILKDILSPKNGSNWGKSPVMISPLLDIVGKGLIWSEGDTWIHRRRIFAPAFHMEDLKGLTGLMQQCADSLVDSWSSRIQEESSREIEVHNEFIRYSADVIATTEFGSSFEATMKIFQHLKEIEKLVQKGMPYMWIPGHRYIPTAERLEIWRIQKELKGLLEELVNARNMKIEQGLQVDRSGPYGHNMLGLMLAKNKECPRRYTVDWIMDEIKTTFIAAHETTALLLTWTMMLLAMNPSWQERLREEVNEACSCGTLSSEDLGKLKMMTMVLNESLRLYTPVATVARKSLKDMQLGNLFVPKNCGFFIPLAYIHHDKDLWGPDADEFRPERFALGGASACKHPMGFLPFSFGGRNCIGQTFAMMEAKIAFITILRQFRFKLSPEYRHAPVTGVTLYPKYGVQIILESLR